MVLEADLLVAAMVALMGNMRAAEVKVLVRLYSDMMAVTRLQAAAVELANIWIANTDKQ